VAVFPIEHAEVAFRGGWTRDEILELHGWCRRFGVSVTRAAGDMVVVNGRFAAYKGRPLAAVEAAMMDALTPIGDLQLTTTIYCDGSGTIDSKPAGIGVVVLQAYPMMAPPKLIHEGCGLGTNNHAEVSAIRRGLQEVPDLYQPVIIRSDSEWALGAVNPKNNWNVQKNVQLVQQVRADLRMREKVFLEHIKGHQPLSSKEGLWNNVADVLARAGRLGEAPRYPRTLAKALTAAGVTP